MAHGMIRRRDKWYCLCGAWLFDGPKLEAERGFRRHITAQMGYAERG